MTPDSLAPLLKSAAQLSPEQEAVLNVLAVHYGYASPALIGKCLYDPGFKDKKGKEPKADTVMPYLEALQASPKLLTSALSKMCACSLLCAAIFPL